MALRAVNKKAQLLFDTNLKAYYKKITSYLLNYSIRVYMNLKDLKQKSPTELLTQAEELGIEDASSMRVQDLMFAILKKVAGDDNTIYGEGTIEVLQDGFGFLRSAQSNYLAGPDDIYVSPAQVKKFGLRTGDTVEGEIRAPKENERYFALTKVNRINFEDPEKSKLRVNFDNLTPLYPTKKLNFDIICGEKDYTTAPVKPSCCKTLRTRLPPIIPNVT